MADFTVVEHKSLLDAFRNHNAAAAAAAMRSHLERSRDRFIKIAPLIERSITLATAWGPSPRASPITDEVREAGLDRRER